MIYLDNYPSFETLRKMGLKRRFLNVKVEKQSEEEAVGSDC